MTDKTPQPLDKKIERYPVILNNKPMKTAVYLAIPTRDVKSSIQNFLQDVKSEMSEKWKREKFCFPVGNYLELIDELAKSHFGKLLEEK